MISRKHLVHTIRNRVEHPLLQFQNALIFRAFSDMLSPVSRGTSTHFLRFVQRGECEWSAILRVTSGTHQFSLDFLSKWLEISLRETSRGFESHPLRQNACDVTASQAFFHGHRWGVRVPGTGAERLVAVPGRIFGGNAASGHHAKPYLILTRSSLSSIGSVKNQRKTAVEMACTASIAKPEAQ